MRKADFWLKRRQKQNLRNFFKLVAVVLFAKLLFGADESLQKIFNPVTYMSHPSAVDFGQQGPSQISYYWRLYDLYRHQDFDLKNRDAFPEFVEKNQTLTWSDLRKGPYYVEISASEKFQNPHRFQTSVPRLQLH
jgi:hypothetical protein